MTSWPRGYGHIAHQTLDSTSSEARRLAEAGEAGPLWISAEHQSAGRGRRGRAWDTGTDNLAATLLLRPKARASAFGQLSFVAALAVAEMALEFAPHAAISLKWPNDVLADDKKLAGMLLESGGDWLSIGIGVNLAHFPRATEFPAIALAQLGIVPPSPQDALRVLAGRFAHWYDAWMHQGFETIRTAWLARAHGLGGPIRARLPNESHDGVFEGLDADGSLLLNQQGRMRTITAGEVFF
ncbi:MAG TPA: biotin--[acetyl-CoA-carboxylase] ligase [Rhizomicrobium sp.]|nr:biotin--[acetyl-CoA-carboxylase] ligase [Rhizomicrobium sp.]